jgi:tetratricopeptide (TPR) repeat protein
MAGVGEAAVQGGDPDDATMTKLRLVAFSDPLRTEPFLVEAALAERAGNYDRATRLLTEARKRDPRSAAARYLYGDTAIRAGRIVDGLREMAVLSRLIPGAAIQLVPALSQFARLPGSAEKLTGILSQNPQLRNPLLLALAADPDNAGLILSLAGAPTPKPSADTRAWESRLLIGMVERGQYDRAYDLWRQFALLPPGTHPLLFNGDFREVPAPAPFNWSLSASGAGIADTGGGKLRVLYYARQDAVIATQMLILPPGAFRFQAPVTGRLAAGALSWSISCVGVKGAKLMDLQLGGTESAAASFTVPASECPGQRVQLNGHALDSPEDSDVQIGPVSLQRVGG